MRTVAMNKRATLAVINRHIEGLPSPRPQAHPLLIIAQAVSIGVPGGTLLNGLVGKSLPDEVVEAVKAYAATMK